MMMIIISNLHFSLPVHLIIILITLHILTVLFSSKTWSLSFFTSFRPTLL